MHRSKLATIIIASGLAALYGCSAQPPAQNPSADLPDPGPDGQYERDFPEAKDGETRALTMIVSQDMQARCDALEPHFEFDVEKPRPQGHAKLAAVADCLNLDGVRQLDVRLVGHADVRGTEPYNHELARDRATQVQQALVAQGVDPSRLQVVSRGELDAKAPGTEYAHGYDRRVDIELLGRDRAPVVSGVDPAAPGTVR